MKILKILVDKIPNDKKYCKFCTILDDTQERFCTVMEQKCDSRCCLITLDEFQKSFERAAKEVLKPVVDSMREVIKAYEVTNEEQNNE